MNVVVDTSVFLAAALENDADSKKILKLLADGHLCPVFNEASWEELHHLTKLKVADAHGVDLKADPTAELSEDSRRDVDFWRGMWYKIFCPHRIMVPWESPGDYIADRDDEKIIAAGLDGELVHRSP